MLPSLRIQRCRILPANRLGRDLVVGDLHGHRSLLERVLDDLRFDPSVDRLFSVGDLVDRGPESLATLELLDEPWFHAVLGNHEMMLLHYLGHYRSRLQPRKAIVHRGGQWIQAALRESPSRLRRLAERVADLPLAIRVDADHPFAVCHTDAGFAWESDDDVDAGARASVGARRAEQATADRQRLAVGATQGGEVLEHGPHPVRLSASPGAHRPLTYVGHTPMPCVLVHASRVYIDRGVRQSEVGAGTLPPVVLEPSRFSQWLRGVSLARAVTPAAGLPALHRRPGWEGVPAWRVD